MLKKQTQPNILSQLKKKVKINKTDTNIDNLKANNLEIIQSTIIAL